MAIVYLTCLALILTSRTACEAAKASVNITASDAPKLVELVDELNIPEDNNATITCSVGSGELQTIVYQWFKDKERLYGSANKIRIEAPLDNYQSVLRIFDLKPFDSALYTCVAQNRFGQHKISTKLNVQVQLKWLERPKDLQVSIGRSLEVPCRADGNPTPKIEWRRLSSASAGAKHDSQPVGSELRFASVGLEDAGQYECRATNGVDEDLSTIVRLEVLGK